MYRSSLHIIFFAILAAIASAAPTVTLDKGVFVGFNNASSQTNSFLGIPFGKPPVGSLQFNIPSPVDAYNGTYNATVFGPSCPGSGNGPSLPANLDLPDYILKIINATFGRPRVENEDCLAINVVQPQNIPSGVKLPVVVWIFGGGFEEGTPNEYPGARVVRESIAKGKPIIYVSMNYRLSAYGFLAGKEVQAAGLGNFGLHDQRLALRWVKKYILAFGGDPERVTIWGESAGAISVALHLVGKGGDTEDLFQAAFMQSGSPIPVGSILKGQPYYDALVADTGCTGSNNLTCLRNLPFATLKAGVDKSPGIFAYQSLNLAWLPRVDGHYLTDTPQNLVLAGKVAPVPLISGDCDDEGTLFTLQLSNITTEQQVFDYVGSNYMPQASTSNVTQVLSLYPQDPTQGSPFGTGTSNQELGPQFKRLAAFQGDLVFQAPRRFFLQHVSARQPTWSFLSKRLKYLPIVGSMHGSDLVDSYGILNLDADLLGYLINFVNKWNPNDGSLPSWPQYSTSAPSMLTLQEDILHRVNITLGTYRQQGMELLTNLSLLYPL